MAKQRENGDYYQTLRARFAGKADAGKDASFRAPADPTDHFFGAGPAADEAPAPRLFDPAGVRALGDGLAERITAHGEAQTSLLAFALRFLVAAFWLTLAGWYVTMAANADSAALAKLFFIIAGAGAAAAILGALLTLSTGRASVKRTKEEAVVLGQRLALETHSLDRAIDRRVDTVSADAFLKSVAFAGGDESANASAFSAYLKRGETGPRTRAPRASLFLLLLSAVTLGAAAIGLGADPARLPLAAYPVAFAGVAIGAVIYASAGLLVRALGAPWRRMRESHAETVAFNAVQSAFASANGVAPSDLNARLHRGQGAGMAMTNRSLDENREYESSPATDSPNAARDSAHQFVQTGFQAAPKPFRTDAFEKNFGPEAPKSGFETNLFST